MFRNILNSMSDFVNPKPFFNEQLTKQLSFHNLKSDFDDIMFEDITKYLNYIEGDKDNKTPGYIIEKNDAKFDFRGYKKKETIKMFLPIRLYRYDTVDLNLIRNEIYNILNFNTTADCFINETNVKPCDEYYRIKNSNIYKEYFREIKIKQQLCNHNNYCIVRGFFLLLNDVILIGFLKFELCILKIHLLNFLSF